MTEDAEAMEDLVAKLNLQFVMATGLDKGLQLVLTGDEQVLMFMGETIWDSECDEREDWSEVPIEGHVIAQANKVLEKLQGFRFKE
jgi:hypothetical protein